MWASALDQVVVNAPLLPPEECRVENPWFFLFLFHRWLNGQRFPHFQFVTKRTKRSFLNLWAIQGHTYGLAVSDAMRPHFQPPLSHLPRGHNSRRCCLLTHLQSFFLRDPLSKISITPHSLPLFHDVTLPGLGPSASPLPPLCGYISCPLGAAHT